MLIRVYVEKHRTITPPCGSFKKKFSKKTKIQGLVRGLLTDYKKPSFLKIQSKLAELRNVKVCHNKKRKKFLCIFDFLLSSSIQPTMTQCHLKPNKEVYLY